MGPTEQMEQVRLDDVRAYPRRPVNRTVESAEVRRQAEPLSQSEIVMMLAALGEQVAVLEKLVPELVGRIEWVLRPAGKGDERSPECSTVTELGGRLQELVARLARVNSVLYGVIESVEL